MGTGVPLPAELSSSVSITAVGTQLVEERILSMHKVWFQSPVLLYSYAY